MSQIPINLDILKELDSLILAILILLIFLSFLLFVTAINQIFRKKILSSGIRTFSAAVTLLITLLLLSIATNFYSYDRLVHERPVAELYFTEVHPQQYKLEISLLDQEQIQEYLLNGDEWQIDARIIKWHGWAQLLGLDALFRLERLSGRYTDIEEDINNERTLYSLVNTTNELDYWKIIRDYKKWLPWVDAYYGSATYLPMQDNASYLLSITQTGLIARPLDEDTEMIIRQW